MTTTRPAALAAALTAALLLTGCDMQPSVTKQQAIERVAQRAQEAFAQLPPGATLKQELQQTDLPCDEGKDSATFVETNYVVEHPAGWPVDESLPLLASYWQKAGYTIVRDDRGDTKLPELVVEHPDDGFRIGYIVAHGDTGVVKATLSSSSPCIDK
jgi:hypothetical protein